MLLGMRRGLVMATMLGSAALTGCATAAKAIFTQPDVTFRGVGVRSLGIDGADFEVLLNIYNPNSYSLGASALRYRLLVDSVEIGSGALDSAFSVARRDSMVVHLPVRIGFRAVQAVGPRLLRGGEIPYRLIGDVTLQSFVGTFNRQFNEGASFDAFKTFRP
ncbi:MAG: LEA type 2 family protein [Gemmatimonadaceae bacterium]|nr:LEA type 2 family protein [Gemmatimonadaceae bacterium]